MRSLGSFTDAASTMRRSQGVTILEPSVHINPPTDPTDAYDRTFTYNADGALTKVVATGASGTYTQNYTYDTAGGLTRIAAWVKA